MYGKALFCCLALWSTGALAQDKAGAYLGGGVGQFAFHEEGDGQLAIDDSALSYRIYGGYRFNDTWAVDGAYGTTDEVSKTGAGFNPGILNATARAEFELLEVRGLAHLGSFFAGIGYWESEMTVAVDLNTLFGPISLPGSDTESGLSVVLGGQWDLERVGIRVEIEAYDMDLTESVYNYGVGVHYRF